MSMTIDLREDERELRALLVRQTGAYAAARATDGSLPKVSAIEVGYAFDQRGWFFVHFDTRPIHDRDGEWTVFLDREPFNRDLLERPDWYAACTEADEVIFILPDGTRRPVRDVTEEEYAALLGEFIKGVMLRAKDGGVFDHLPKQNECQIDIEEFNGHWAWPEYEQLGKSNLVQV